MINAKAYDAALQRKLQRKRTESLSVIVIRSSRPGCSHIDIAEVHTAESRMYLLLAVGRTTEFVSVEMEEKATQRIVGGFLHHLIAAVPYRVHTVLADNGTRFTTLSDEVDAGSSESAAKQKLRAVFNCKAIVYDSRCISSAASIHP